jgi:transposase-like protein
MPKNRKSYAPSLKAKVAVEAIKAQRTAAEIAKIYDVHPNLISVWKKHALTSLPELFENGHEARAAGADAEKDELYRQIGLLKVELEFLKKKSGLLG